MNLTYVTTYDARDIANWSGLGTHIARSLEAPDVRISFIGPLTSRHALAFRGLRQLYRATGRAYMWERERRVQAGWARQVSKSLVDGPAPDVIVSPGSYPVAYLDTDTPIVIWADACFAGMIDFYPGFKDLRRRTLREGHRAEEAALQKAALVFYASDWAADAAVRSYDVDPSKVRVVPFGANLDEIPSSEATARMISARPQDKCQLLFLGADWDRKGGDIAVDVAERLNEAGLPTELTAIGERPPADPPSSVRAVGFISKSSPQGRSQLRSLLAASHFLILPTKAECFGVVFCEASAFGVPSLANAVGGVPSAVRSGANGQLFEDSPSVAEKYVDYVLAQFTQYSGYLRLAASSRQEYCDRLNWSVAGSTVRRALDELTSSNGLGATSG